MTKHQAALTYLTTASRRVMIPPRAMALLYLADWEACLDWGRPITDVRWCFLGGMPTFIAPKADEDAPAYQLAAHDRLTLDRVIKETTKLGYDELETLVSSTIPAMLASEDPEIDLVMIAAAYNKVKMAA